MEIPIIFCFVLFVSKNYSLLQIKLEYSFKKTTFALLKETTFTHSQHNTYEHNKNNPIGPNFGLL